MTVFTNVGRKNVCKVFARRIRAVMTADAAIDNRAVIEGCRNPAVGRVAGIATIAARNVRRVLADGNCIVVAG